jgi:isoquinoline 1-oxidoreductase beta subunit
MATLISESRRDFLKMSSAVGGGLLVGFVLPGAARFAEAAAPAFQPNAFIRITPDNVVTVIVGLSEMGQGVLTSIPMLVAEELEADWSKIKIEQAPADPAFNNPIFGTQATGGSTSIRGHWEPMRKAGAVAREMLIAAAVDTWKVDQSSCRAERGRVIHASGKTLTYGQLANKAATLPAPTEVKLKDAKDFKILGKGAKRLDTPGKINGTAKYGMDVRLPGMLTAVVARSPVAGGKVASFDAGKANAVPGVKQVVQIGSGVAVVATGYWAAKQGRDALEIQWDEGANASLSSDAISKAMGELADKGGATARKDGDVNAATAVKKLEAVYEAPYLAHACMEPMNCTAWVKPDGVEIWAGTQAQGINQAVLSKVAGCKPEQVKVNTMLLGGGFGRRFAQDFTIDAVSVSKALGAPVKVIFPREDDMKGHFYRPASYVKFSAGLDEAGSPLLFSARVACSSVSQAAGFPHKDGVDGFAVEGIKELPYDCPNVQVEWSQYEPGIGVWFWRSVGHSQNFFFSESFIDEMAAAAGKDPFEYRRALLTKQPRHKAVLEMAASKAGWGTPLPTGRARGIAVCESFGSFVAEVAEVSVVDDKVRVHRVVCAVDCGMIANPDIVKRQMESAIVFGLSAALYGKITIKDGRVEQSNFHDYQVLRMNETPQVEVHIVESAEKPGGVGEPGTPPIAPAVANALYALTHKRIRKLPIATEDLKTA